MTKTDITVTAADIARFYVDPYPGRKGSERIVFECVKCSGTGSVSWGVDVSAVIGRREVPKVCFDCEGHGRYSRLVSSLRATARRQAKARAEAEARVADADLRREEFKDAFPELVAALAELADEDTFLADLLSQIESVAASLTEAQIEAAEKAIARTRERVARREAEKAAEVDVPAGRHVVEGEVVSVKTYETEYGTTFKMLVKADGYKVFGTIPRSLPVDLRGARVRFTATLEPKETGFGFFSRPTKAEVL